MAKTLNHYSQQIKALAPDAVALDRAKQLGDLLLQAKAAVKAAGKLWTDWLQSDCELTTRTAQRFMTIATRWDDPAFTEARSANPQLAIREADKVLAANSTRKTTGKQTRNQQLWDAAFNDRHAYDGWHCTCGNHLRAQKGVVPYCAGKRNYPHDPRPMICEVQDGFLIHYGDMATRPELVDVAEQLRAEVPEATYFTSSSGCHWISVSNALDSKALPGMWIDLSDDYRPGMVIIGGITDNHIVCSAEGQRRSGQWQALEPLAGRVMKALGWEA
jgi:hypothetical protein